MSVEKDVRTELGKLPIELKQQYSIIYNDTLDSAPSTASIVRRTFSWMLAAQRAMTVEELIAAVALDDDGYYHEDLDVSRLLDICRNLIVVTIIDNNSTKQNFQWAHLSVREFFDGLPDYSLDYIHTIALLRCLGSFDLALQRDRNTPSTDSPNSDVLRAYSIYLFEHAELSGLKKPNSEIAPRMKAFMFDQQYRPTTMFNEWRCLIQEFYENSILPQDSKDVPLSKKRHFSVFEANSINLLCTYGLLSVIGILEDIKSVPWKSYMGRYDMTALFAATNNGKFDIAQWLLERKIFEADETHNHISALYGAARANEEEIVALLLKHGADPLWRSQEGFERTPLYMACKAKNFNNLKRMLEKIELLHKESPEKASALCFDWKKEALFATLLSGRNLASQFLIQRGANIHLLTSRTDEFMPQYRQHSTTLQIAAQCSELAVVSLLLEKSSQSVGSEILEVTGFSSELGSKAHEAYVNALDQHKCSALHYLARRSSSTPEESEAIMKILLRHGADPRSVSDEGVTVLHVAAAIGSLDSVNLLMGMGLDMATLTFNGATILHIAAGGNCSTATMIRYLTAKGVDPLSRDYYGRTPLHYAAAVCNVSALQTLLEHTLGVDSLSQYQAKGMATSQIVTHSTYPAPQLISKLKTLLDDVDGRGETLLHVLGTERENTLRRYHGRNQHEKEVTQVKDTAQFLLNLGASMNKCADNGRTPLLVLSSLAVAPHSGLIVAKELLARGADPNIPDTMGQTPLHLAARCWWDEGARDLMQAGANIEATDHTLSTPLHVATREGFPQMTELFLSKNADCGARDHIGATPLHYATHDRSLGFPILIKKGADINALDLLGATPLHWAAKQGQEFSVQNLIRSGANPEIIDHFGATAMQYAAWKASVPAENEFGDSNYIKAWFQLFKASEQWCRSKNVRPRTFLKRSQSFVRRSDYSWGDFRENRTGAYSSSSVPLYFASPRHKLLRVSSAASLTSTGYSRSHNSAQVFSSAAIV